MIMDMDKNQAEANVEIITENKSDQREASDILYTVEESPPWYLCILFGFQHFLTAFGSLIGMPMLLSQVYCIDTDYVALSEIIGTVFFVSGIVTILQTTFGVRLPILQGTSVSFLTPILAILNQPKWKCPYTEARNTYGANVTFTEVGLPAIGSTGHQEIWHQRIREVQGAIMIASLFQMVIGIAGLIGFALRYIGPLVITSTITLIGLSLFQTAAEMASQQWWIALMTILLFTILSQYLKNVRIQCTFGNKPYGKNSLPVFVLFPVMIAILISWGVCAILTTTGTLSDKPGDWGYAARTDRSLQVLQNASWFRFPYPGQWGLPTVSAASVFGILAGILAAMLESIGGYYACANITGAPPPPQHAINRAILVQGLGCFIAGLWGTGQGTTVFGENTGTIGITKVGSRLVVQVTGCLLLFLGCLGKFGAAFASIPQPVVGGIFMVTFGMITGVGLSNLQYVDLNSSRNIYIIGTSIFLGLSLPVWIKANQDVIYTGVSEVDQILSVLLGTNMFVGAVVAFVLDNTIPGTLEERGILSWIVTDGSARGKERNGQSIYNLPCVQDRLNGISVLRYCPICPSFLKTGSNIERNEQNKPASERHEGLDNKLQDLTIGENTRL